MSEKFQLVLDVAQKAQVLCCSQLPPQEQESQGSKEAVSSMRRQMLREEIVFLQKELHL